MNWIQRTDIKLGDHRSGPATDVPPPAETPLAAGLRRQVLARVAEQRHADSDADAFLRRHTSLSGDAGPVIRRAAAPEPLDAAYLDDDLDDENDAEGDEWDDDPAWTYR